MLLHNFAFMPSRICSLWGFLQRHSPVISNRLISPGKNISPWRALNIKNMASGITSRPLARPFLAMATSHSRCGELWCEQDGDIYWNSFPPWRHMSLWWYGLCSSFDFPSLILVLFTLFLVFPWIICGTSNQKCIIYIMKLLLSSTYQCSCRNQNFN